MDGTRVKVAAVVIAVLGVVLAALLQSRMVQFWTFTIQDVTRILTPLILTALFMERALEVLLTPWRGEGAEQISRDVETAKHAANVQAVATNEKALIAYKAKTRQIAYLSGLALGVVISALGMRCLEPFFEPKAFADLGTVQHGLLNGVDVLLTGALLAGGADGLHKLVSVFTNYMDATAEKAKG
jgi:hypothetical protein